MPLALRSMRVSVLLLVMACDACVWRDAFICVTWRWNSYVWQDTLRRVTRDAVGLGSMRVSALLLVMTWDACVLHDAVIHVCNIKCSHVRHGAVIHVCDMTRSDACLVMLLDSDRCAWACCCSWWSVMHVCDVISRVYQHDNVSAYECIYIYIHVYMYTYIYIYMYIYVYIYIYIHTYT